MKRTGVGLCSLFLVMLFVSSSFAIMESMMGEQKGKMGMGMMTGNGDPQAKLACAEQWLKKAIDLHEVHMKDPKTATEASQMEMMDQMKKAYGCITGTGSDMSGTQSKEVEGKEPKKAEPNKH
ncbi:MAG: hypothetical protein HZB62_05010 [Nitrospirae bacterium]|nr:hypothetical protein [Nitrospirota bacterium]